MTTARSTNLGTLLPTSRWQHQSDPAERLKSLQEVEMPVPLRLAVNAAFWFNAVEEFHAYADQWLTAQRFGEVKDLHRQAISQMIASGEDLVLGIREFGLPDGTKFTLDDIEATIEMLETRKRCMHGQPLRPAIAGAIEKLLEVA